MSLIMLSLLIDGLTPNCSRKINIKLIFWTSFQIVSTLCPHFPSCSAFSSIFHFVPLPSSCDGSVSCLFWTLKWNWQNRDSEFPVRISVLWYWLLLCFADDDSVCFSDVKPIHCFLLMYLWIYKNVLFSIYFNLVTNWELDVSMVFCKSTGSICLLVFQNQSKKDNWSVSMCVSE